MNMEQVDRYCDRYEQRLKSGEQLTARQFLQELRLPEENPLLAELLKLERHYLGAQAFLPVDGVAHPRPETVDVNRATVSMPAAGVEKTVGGYKLLQKIGEGGMGVVYMAAQSEPIKRRVALKIIKPGMDTKEVLARFAAEQQALAMMDHPNIARVLDAGSTDAGRPYFVMELVKGIPITTYCDEKHLTPRERLELFVPICQAVQHAHQKGIIHRDLKPSNILVAQYDDQAVPKIIDFGVAKALSQELTEKTVFTQYGQIVGTIDYMSPEQATFNQLDVDTRSDIYSLGVLLYELLTGSTPFDKKRLRTVAFDELLRIIQNEEPPRPSTRLSTTAALPAVAANRRTEAKKLSGLVRGELDWIVMKALEKDRSRRYETANGLATDVQRFLNDEPVLACPPSVSYRLSKVIRRNKVAAAITVTLVLALVAVAVAGGLAINRRALAQALARLEDEQYAHNMILAQRAWTDSNISRTLQLLGDERPEQAGWEWDYLKRMCHTDMATLHGHSNMPVEVVRFSPDGNYIASGGWDSTVQIWDAASRQPLVPLEGYTIKTDHHGEVYGVAFSPNGKLLVTGSGEIGDPKIPGEVRVWDTATWAQIAQLPEQSSLVYGVDFSRDGKLLATCGYDRTVQVWDANSYQRLFKLEGHQQAVMSVAFHPDGTRLASADGGEDLTEVYNDGVIKLWDLDAQKEIREFRGHEGPLLCMEFSPDGSTIASGAWDGTVRLWDVETGEPKSILSGHAFRVLSLAFRPDGNQLVSGSDDGSARIWDLNGTDEPQVLRGHTGAFASVDFHPNGRHIVSGSYFGAIKIWDPALSEECVTLRGNNLQMTGVEFSRDGTQLAASNGDKTVFVWNLKNLPAPPILLAHNWPVWSVAFHADGRHLATGAGHQNNNAIPGELSLWDLDRKSRISLEGHQSCVIGVAISPDGRLLASGSGDRTVMIWDAEKGSHRRTLRGHTAEVYCVAFSPDGNHVASGAIDAKLKIWDVHTGQCLKTLDDSELLVKDVEFSRDGRRIAAACLDNVLRIWDVETGRLETTLKGHANSPIGLAFSPDGRRLVSGGLDHTVKMWNPATGQELLTLAGHRGMVFGVAFSPDGRTIASASNDGTVKLWTASPWTDHTNAKPER